MTKVTLSESQQAALDDFRDFLDDDERKEYILAGFAGSGKSWLVKYMVRVSNREWKMKKLLMPTLPQPRYFFTATTNKAAKVLGNFMEMPAKTIHSLLGLSVRNNYSNGKTEIFQKRDPDSLDDSVIFIDEASMVDRKLLYWIHKHVTEASNCKVVFIGDSYQLAPVKEDRCPVFDNPEKVNYLTEIQRQAAGSPIIQLSTFFREILDEPDNDWPAVDTQGADVLHYTDSTEWFGAIEGAYRQQHQADDLKVLAWSNERVREYNTWLRAVQGEQGVIAQGEIVISNKPIHSAGGSIVAMTDSMFEVIKVEPTESRDIKGYGVTLTNEISTIKAFQPHDWKDAKALQRRYKRDKEWKEFFHIENCWTDLRPIHAQTVHKSQGSTYKEVFIDLSNIGRNQDWRSVARLVYVAITRASDRVHLYGSLPSRGISNFDLGEISNAFSTENISQ